jgi:hypothetical protein
MSKRDLKIYHETLLDLQKEIESIQKILKNSNMDIPTKYAYKGWQGWSNWSNLKGIFDEVSDTTRLLDKHFSDIFKLMLKDSSDGKSIDVISLGVGLGDEDINILKKISKFKEHNKFSFFGIDYSNAIVERACYFIRNKIEKISSLKLESITGLCIDFENLSNHKILFHKNKNIKFFHLLGLTLGNNKEESILKNITDVLDEGDYLLFDVDCSVDKGDKKIQTLLDTYSSEMHITNAFLTNVLLYGVSFRSKNNFDFGNFKFPWEVRVNYLNLNDCKKKTISDIEDTITLSRQHIYKNGNHIIGQRICDFSNKYSSTAFSKFISSFCDENNFEIIESLKGGIFWGIDESSNKLILIKKKSPIIDDYNVNVLILSDKSTPQNKILENIEKDIENYTNSLSGVSIKEIHDNYISFITELKNNYLKDKVSPNKLIALRGHIQNTIEVGKFRYHENLESAKQIIYD